MNSRIAVGRIQHARVTPVDHRFEYPVYLYAFDLDELPQLDRTLPLFGYNRFRPVSICDRDCLDARPGSIREKLARLLRERGITDEIGRVIMVTDPSYFGHVFNPVSFYYAFSPDGRIAAMAAEVSNVVGDRHLYTMRRADGEEAGRLVRYRFPKALHVSPFNAVEGHYECLFADIRESLEIHVNLHRDGRPVMTAWIKGDLLPMDAPGMRRLLLRHPLMPWLTLPRILSQAFVLFARKHLAFHERPVVTSPDTLRVRGPSRFQRLCMRRIEKVLERIHTGSLAVRTPEVSRTFGAAGAAPAAAVTIRDYAFFSSVGVDGDIGFGEAYMRGEWDSPGLTATLRLLIENRDALTEDHVNPAWISRLLHRRRHEARANTLDGSRRNIREHYDLSNEFFARFLDPSMTYSCGFYETAGDSPEQAQMNKLDRIIRKAGITAQDHVLEIGCGWGSFAIRAARTTGCRVTGLTLSKEQLALARERVTAAGLDERVEIVLEDYRRAAGLFDKIVSIEMLEAVGHEHLGAYFAACDRLLAPDGLVVIQVITIPDQRYDAYRHHPDWIQKHIFPGGLLPSLAAMSNAMTRHSRLIIENLENIGIHYARTLREWHDRFESNDVNRAELDRRNPEFRKWIYYFAYCEAAFGTRTIEDLQMVLTRPNNRRLPLVPSPAASTSLAERKESR